ncbi:MAG TPA: hypothetical protein VGI95_21930 [Caulobacteraceae bacterium]|jgi:hypothetical protein
MPALPSDRALRRLVAELATATPEDIEHVLDQLEPRHRQGVQSLVDELFGGAVRTVHSPATEAVIAAGRRAGVSPWALARLEGGTGPLPAGVAAGVTISPVALQALRSCVAELEPSPVASGASADAVGAAWLRRLWAPVPRAAFR